MGLGADSLIFTQFSSAVYEEHILALVLAQLFLCLIFTFLSW